MVDEFQDTNRLQCDLVDLLRGPGAELFFVGDEFQSIYGFRHADVRVFRERRAQQSPPENRYQASGGR
jgi:superfamily I DNA/RNA helicase